MSIIETLWHAYKDTLPPDADLQLARKAFLAGIGALTEAMKAIEKLPESHRAHIGPVLISAAEAQSTFQIELKSVEVAFRQAATH